MTHLSRSKRAALALALLGFAACGAADSTSPAPVVAPVVWSLSLSPPTATIITGYTTVLTATVLGSDGKVFNDGSVTWLASDPAVMSISPSDSSTGSRRVTLLALKPGVAVVSASIAGGVSAAAVIVVSAKPVIDAADAAFVYSEQDGMLIIPPPSGATVMRAYAINDSAQVAGSAFFGSSSWHAFIWTKTAGFRDLGGMPGGAFVQTEATAINKNGQVAGAGISADGNTHAFRWTAATGMTDLGLLPGTTRSYALGINGRGEVVGYAAGPDGEHPFRWTQELGMQDMSMGGVVLGRAMAINEGGQIAGALILPSDRYDWAGAVMWTASGSILDVIRCVYPSGYVGDGCGSAAIAINNTGTIVGTDGFRAIMWTRADSVTVLPGVPSAEFSTATGINDSGTIIGNSGHEPSGFIWSAGGGYRSVALPAGRHFLQLTGINNNGMIVGWIQ